MSSPGLDVTTGRLAGSDSTGEFSFRSDFLPVGEVTSEEDGGTSSVSTAGDIWFDEVVVLPLVREATPAPVPDPWPVEVLFLPFLPTGFRFSFFRGAEIYLKT